MKTNKYRTSIFAGFLTAIFSAALVAAQALTPTPAPAYGVDVRSDKLASKLMAREMPYRVILPAAYANKPNDRFRAIYLLHGLFGRFDNWTDKTQIAEYAADHNFIIITPEGGNGWYIDSETVPNDKYESYIVKELIPEIDKKFRTVPDREHRAIAGLSMGGYGAIKFGLKYPEMFSLVGSFSGAFDAPMRGVTVANTWPSIMSVYGSAGSETRKANDIFQIIRVVTSEKIKTLPFIYQSCGTEDFLFQTNRDFNALLIDKKISHEYRETPGEHTWTFWDEQVQEFLLVADRKLSTK